MQRPRLHSVPPALYFLGFSRWLPRSSRPTRSIPFRSSGEDGIGGRGGGGCLWASSLLFLGLSLVTLLHFCVILGFWSVLPTGRNAQRESCELSFIWGERKVWPGKRHCRERAPRTAPETGLGGEVCKCVILLKGVGHAATHILQVAAQPEKVTTSHEEQMSPLKDFSAFLDVKRDKNWARKASAEHSSLKTCWARFPGAQRASPPDRHPEIFRGC